MKFARTHARTFLIENTPLTSLVFSVLVLLLLAPVAHAQINSPPPTGYKHLWSVPGLVNTVTLGTFFACTNTGTASATVGVQVFNAAGVSVNDPTATAVSVAAGGTTLIMTEAAAGLSGDSILGLGVISKGSARILSSARAGIICSAFLADTLSDPPTSMTALTIVKKLAQKGE